MDDVVTLARADGPRGEVVLRRRGTGDGAVDELVVNGAFAMDSADTSSERALGRLAFPFLGARVLLGGLGLGYTAAELLRSDPALVEVVEIEPALVAWAHGGVTPVLGQVASDPRIRLHVDDIAVVLARRRPPRTWDAIVLDVDNGPDFLIHAENAGLYSPAGVRLAHQRLSPGGLLAIWCQGPAPDLDATMSAVAPTEERTFAVQRGNRRWSYATYTLRRNG